MLLNKNFRKLEVLIVDNDKIHAKILELKLNEIGIHRIAKTFSFPESEAEINSAHYDLLFLDFYFENEKTCLDFGEKILLHSEIPIIYITSFYNDFIFSQIPKRANIAFLPKSASTFDIKKEIELIFAQLSINNSKLKAEDFFLLKRGNLSKNS